MKNFKNNFVKLGVIAVVVFGLILAIVSITQNWGKNKDTINRDAAIKKLNQMYSSLNVNKLTPRKGNVQNDDEDVVAILPDISEFPFVVNPVTNEYLTIYSSPEKSGIGYQNWLCDMAEKFNKSGATINGEPVSVGVRSVPSGLGANFISTHKYTPDIFMPSSELYGNILSDKGISINKMEERLAGNVTGVVLSKSKNDALVTKHGSLNGKNIAESVSNGELVIGYVNPLDDANGLNFILTTFYAFDSANPLSEVSISKFKKFQDNIPYVSNDVMQLEDSVYNGTLDGFVSDYQAYVNSSLKSDYVFVPLGVRNDQPVYEIGTLSALKKEMAVKFVDYCKTSEAQSMASDKGFNGFNDYKYEFESPDGATIGQMQETWKREKSGSRDLTVVFVADISGSMEGSPLLKLKASLNRASTFIDSNTNIGLVTFSDSVNIALPVAKFDSDQKAYFTNAVRTMSSGGATAMFDAVVVAQKMLIDAQKQNPNTELKIFVLTDGESNRGHMFEDIEDMSRDLRIPIYTIGYNADLDVLKSLSDINEATTMNAETDDVIYKLQSLFNAQM